MGTACVQCGVLGCLYCSQNSYCSVCQMGYMLSTVSLGMCVQCQVPGCLACSSNNVCMNCLLGYTLNTTSNTCAPCGYPCLSCLPNSLGCQTCSYPFSHTAAPNNTCYSCQVSNCFQCPVSNPALCSLCAPDFFLLGNTCYKASNAQCRSYLSNGMCVQCAANYVMVSGLCIQCVDNPSCLYCNSTYIYQCLECQPGTFLNGFYCFRCP